jgi:tRNA(adenine34) deaminase
MAATSPGGATASPAMDRSQLVALQELAITEARAAAGHGDVPVGAVVVELATGEVVAGRHNERELSGDPTAHAEILALRDAAEAVGSWRLDGHALVVTLEPCPMCAGAALAARLALVAFGASDPKAGSFGSLYNFGADPRLNHELVVVDGIRAEECAVLLGEFFAERR